MDCLFDAVKGLPEYRLWEDAVCNRGSENFFTGLSSSAKAHFACLFADMGKIIYITANELEAARRCADFKFLHGDRDSRVVMLPAREDMLYDVAYRYR